MDEGGDRDPKEPDRPQDRDNRHAPLLTRERAISLLLRHRIASGAEAIDPGGVSVSQRGRWRGFDGVGRKSS